MDTNVLVYLLIAGDRTSEVRSLYARDSDWRSEAFAMVELSNILATYTRTGAIRRAQAVALFNDAEVLLSTLHNVSNDEALEVAMDFQISAYDARFITTARQLKSKLVTEDVKLRRAVPAWTTSIADALQ